MIGYGGESVADALDRLEAIWDLGGLPFAQLYQPPGEKIQYSKEWLSLARRWSRPAAMFKMHEKTELNQIMEGR